MKPSDIVKEKAEKIHARGTYFNEQWAACYVEAVMQYLDEQAEDVPEPIYSKDNQGTISSAPQWKWDEKAIRKDEREKVKKEVMDIIEFFNNPAMIHQEKYIAYSKMLRMNIKDI